MAIAVAALCTTVVWIEPAMSQTARLAPQKNSAAAGNVSPERKLTPEALSRELSARNTRGYSIDEPLQSESLGLNQAVGIALSRYPSIADVVSQLAQASGSIDVARAGYFPQVTAGIGSNTNTLTGSGSTTSVQISQMIYDFGKVSGAVGQAKATVQRQQAQVLKEIQSVEQQTAAAYINVHRYQELVRIAGQQVEAMQKVYEMSKFRANAGVSTQSDPVQARSRLQSAQANLIQIKALEEQAREHLRTMLGGPLGNAALVLPDEQATRVPLDDRPDTTMMPDVMMAEAEELVAEKQLDTAKANMLPTVSVDYTLEKNITGVNSSTYIRHGSNRTVMLNLSWSVFQGGALNAQVKAARYALDAARSRVERARLDGSDAARGYLQQVLGAKGRMSVLEKRRLSLSEARDLYREQYKLGTRSILDLLNTEQEFFQSVSDEASVQHDYWIGLVDYVAATGSGNEFYGVGADSIPGMDFNQ
ncbi:TolC family outer membrane protein [Paraburkholderia adhaesiva]|uniref:TolC family outer membrane protein n=1 Tax=Paraburkholderia adhaesiva TaxID=2883244 RepID=UPI001F22EA6D|nr:TolC family outer membrane protein [Paraburkholderia adhaesiva]